MRFSRLFTAMNIGKVYTMELIDRDWIIKRMSGKRGEQARLAEHMGVKPDIIAKILSGKRRVQPEEMRRIHAFFAGADAAGQGRGGTRDAALVAVYDIEVSAGHGTLAPEVEAPAELLAFPTGYLRHITSAAVRDLAIVTVKGDSMSPTLRERDVVLIDMTKTNLGYDGLFVLRLDGALHVKRVNRGSVSGVVRIISDNHAVYSPFERALDEVEVVGKVLWYGRKE